MLTVLLTVPAGGPRNDSRALRVITGESESEETAAYNYWQVGDVLLC